jgi:hypothetical protein
MVKRALSGEEVKNSEFLLLAKAIRIKDFNIDPLRVGNP